MKLHKLMLFLLLTTFHFYSFGQDQHPNAMQFPHVGTYNLQADQGSGTRDYNQVAIGSNTFSLQMNGGLVRAYQIASEFKGGFRVEQVLQNGQTPTGALESFNVRIFSATENEYFVEISYPQGSEKIHLIKQ